MTLIARFLREFAYFGHSEALNQISTRRAFLVSSKDEKNTQKSIERSLKTLSSLGFDREEP